MAPFPDLPLFPRLTRSRVEEVLSRLTSLPRLRLGASTAGYQVEGGFNGEEEPANNWFDWERSGRVPRTGLGSDFWNQWAGDLDRAQQMGLDSFRLGVEWARLERSPDRPGGRVQLDPDGLAGYARILAGCHARGLRPAVTLHHFTHPRHEGQRLWLEPDHALERIVPYAVAAIEALGDLLVTEHHAPPIPYLITINEPFMYAGATHLAGMFPAPPGSWGMTETAAVLQTLHCAHVQLYRELHALYQRRGWPRPTITFNPWASIAFETDLQQIHLLMARARGIPRAQLGSYLAEEKGIFEEECHKLVAGRRTQASFRQLIERIARRIARTRLSPERFSRLIDTIYQGPEGEALLDAVGLDFYDPWFGDYGDLGFPTGVRVHRAPWRWQQVPAALPTFLKLYGRAAGGLVEVELLEQGMAHHCEYDGRPEQRRDGITRGALLRAGILACLEARAAGVPVGSYFHWSLIDNYEWGSFAPRFGILGVVYPEHARRLATDIVGEDVAGQLRRVSQALADQDREALMAVLAEPDER